MMGRFLNHPIYVHGLRFHSSNECDVQLLGARMDQLSSCDSGRYRLITNPSQPHE
jgi:hypothetical protein